MRPLIRCRHLLNALIAPLLIGAAAAQTIPSFEARYQLTRNDLSAARVEVSLTRRDHGGFHYRQRTKTTGLVALWRDDRITETSRGRWLTGSPRPDHYHYQRLGSKARRVTVDFDWTQNTARINADTTTWSMTIPPNAVDKLSVNLALMAAMNRIRPAPDHADPVTFAVADGGKLKHYLFDAVGPEIVRTARGQFNTVVVQRRQAEHNPRRTQLWLAPRLHYLPVRIRHTERDEGVFELRLERYLAGDGDRNAR